MSEPRIAPSANKFHVGNGDDGKHYWLTPPDLFARLNARYSFNFDPCPYPKPEAFDGLTADWGSSSYVNPPSDPSFTKARRRAPQRGPARPSPSIRRESVW